MKILVALMAASLVGLSGPASAGGGALIPLHPRRSDLAALGYRIDLGAADDPTAPRAWQGPVRVAGAGRRNCSVDPGVAILERPFGLSHDRFLVASTYSGSTTQVYVIELSDCAVTAKSPAFTGPARFRSRGIRLPGLGDFYVDAKGGLIRR